MPFPITITFDGTTQAGTDSATLTVAESESYVRLDRAAVVIKDTADSDHIKRDLNSEIGVGPVGSGLLGHLVGFL